MVGDDKAAITLLTGNETDLSHRESCTHHSVLHIEIVVAAHHAIEVGKYSPYNNNSKDSECHKKGGGKGMLRATRGYFRCYWLPSSANCQGKKTTSISALRSPLDSRPKNNYNMGVSS